VYNKITVITRGIEIKKLLIISLILIGSIGLVSCARSYHKGEILQPEPISGVPGSAGRISIEEFTEKEIVFKILISLGGRMWLEFIIEDEEGNAISEESFKHGVMRSRYTIKMKAKEEYEFRKGENYTLYIGYKWIPAHPIYENFQLFYRYKFVL